MISFAAVVPARRDSMRLPDKPLVEIGGAPMIVRVLNQAQKSGAKRVIAAVDDDEVAAVVRDAGFEFCMTGACDSGSARVCEAIRLCEIAEDMIVVNVQGDEPFIEPELVCAVAECLHNNSDCGCATAMRSVLSAAEFADAAAVKVVADANSRALYFSRAPIPHLRDAESDADFAQTAARIHIGIYAYFPSVLRRLCALPPSFAETSEQLEQLRLLHYGEAIALVEFASRSFGVDTPSDLTRARALVGETGEQ